MIRIGIAGWDYSDWIGPVYPLRRGRGFDRLAFISRYVDVIEINSSFYRPADPRHAESWLRRTESQVDFRFTAKAHRSLSHEPTVPSPEGIRSTLAGLEPIRDAGRLGALLIQFPQSFHDGPRTRERLQALADSLEHWPSVVELRHDSWGADEIPAWLSERGLAWCVVDQPAVGRTLRAALRVTASPAYLRLHGRNTANWFKTDAGRDARYDYLYSTTELAGLAQTAREMSAVAEELFVIQNNHFRGQALVNTLQMKSLLQEGLPLAPQDLVSSYPDLESRVRVERERLF